MSDKLEQLAIKYAKAHRDLRLAHRVFEGACEAMCFPPDDKGCTPRRFDELRCPDGIHRRWVYEGTHTDVTNEDDLAVIMRWLAAHAAKVAAARKLGALRGAFLKHGKILLAVDE